jgi:hypothetical protein
MRNRGIERRSAELENVESLFQQRVRARSPRTRDPKFGAQERDSRLNRDPRSHLNRDPRTRDPKFGARGRESHLNRDPRSHLNRDPRTRDPRLGGSQA